MKVRIEFSIDNAAFEDVPMEVERTLASAAISVAHFRRIDQTYEEPELQHRLRDSNGNTIGFVELMKEGD